MRELDLHWLAGLLEGEGSFMAGPPSSPNSPIVTVQMTDEDIIDDVAHLFGASYCKCDQREAHWKFTYKTTLKGKRAVEMMKRLRPLMGKRRKEQIARALDSYVTSSNKLGRDNEIEIVRALLKGDRTHRDIAKEFGVVRETVSRVKQRYDYVFDK